MERDLVITEKIEELKAKKREKETTLKEIPKYITNLMVDGISCRAMTSKGQLLLPYEKLVAKKNVINSFEAEFGKTDPLFHIYGYKWSDWMEDFHNLIKEMELKESIAKISSSIKKLERFYSEDKKATDSFNALLDDIEEL